MSSAGDVGTLHRLSPREVFEHEAYDFTTWLEENADSLGAAIGLDLTATEREKDAGDFSADLLAEDEEGRRIIIENQLEQTDHGHLGQVLTYLAVLDAAVAIWVTADARPEHVSAVSWLNESASGSDFYLVKVEGVRVDDSRAAPLFTRIVGPSPDTRAASRAKEELDERDQARRRFFERLLSVSSEHTDRFDNISPKPRSNISASGGNGFTFNCSVTRSDSRAYFFIDFRETRSVDDAAYEVFDAHRGDIEAAVDFNLSWVQDDKRRRAIEHEVDGGYADEERWEEVQVELARALAQIESATEPYLEEARRRAREEMRRLEEREGGGEATPGGA